MWQQLNALAAPPVTLPYPIPVAQTAMDDDYSMDLDYDPGHAIPTPKATPILKGRKRWLADVADMKQAVKAGLELDGLAVKGKYPLYASISSH